MARTALVVDDSPIYLEIMVQMLHNEGFHAICLPFINEVSFALQRINRLDLIILDVEFILENGRLVMAQQEFILNIIEHVRLMRNEPIFACLKVVAYTGYLEMQPHLTQMGFDDVIAKPLNADRLAKQLNMYIN